MAYFEVNKKPRLTFPTLTGSIVTFNSQYAGLPLKSHKIALTAAQSGSGTPSPSNPRPISGYSAINISQSGADTSTPTIHTITIGSTVYGGEYDARTGVLTVTHGMIDMGALYYVQGATDRVDVTKNVIQSATGLNPKRTSNIDMICSVFSKDNSTLTSTTNGIRFFTNVLAEDFATTFNGQQLVFELETPTTIQLPPCPIDTLEVNNIWADTGDTTLQYPKFG